MNDDNFNTRRRQLLATLGACGLAAAAVPAFAQGKLPKLTVSYTATPEFGAVFIAQEQGFFKKRGLDVTLQLIPVAPNVPAAVMSDSVQIGGTTSTVLLQAIDSGLDLVGVAGGGVFDASTATTLQVVARSGVAVKEPQDLVGKKIGVPGFGAAIHVLTRKWIMDKGVDPKRVTFIEVPIPQMPDVLKGGSVDAVAAPEPFVSRMVQGGIGSTVPSYTSVMPFGVSTVLYVATRKWATTHGAEVQAFRGALEDAIGWSGGNRDAAMDHIGKYFKVPPQVLKATPFPNLHAGLKDEHLRFWSDTMRTQDMLKKQPVLSSAILK